MHKAATAYTRSDVGAVAPALRRWLFSGRCQSRQGAYCAWRDASTGELSFEYPEINGYFLTFAASLHDLSPVEMRAARRSADWLLGRLRRADLSARSGWDGGAVYTFDLAMMATGLLSFGRRFGASYLEAGLRLVEFLGEEIRTRGHLRAVAAGARASHRGWASEGQAHLLKATQCFLLADELTDLANAELLRPLVEELEQLQQPDGRFVTEPEGQVTMLHPHLYALEGLWIWGTARRSSSMLERVRAGLNWALGTQLASGGFPRFLRVSGQEAGPEQADVTAQLIRLSSLALGFDTRIEDVEKAAERLISTMTGGSAQRAAVYQPSSSPLHENAWATMFAAQAIDLISNRAPLRWSELV